MAAIRIPSLKVLISGVFVAVLGLVAQPVFAVDVTVPWGAVEGAEGYKLYWNDVSIKTAPYAHFIDVGNKLEGVVTGLEEGRTYYFAVTAYVVETVTPRTLAESAYSDEISYTTPRTQPTSDTDKDADGVLDGVDNCPLASNADQRDSNANGVGDACENPDRVCSDQDGDGASDVILFGANPAKRSEALYYLEQSTKGAASHVFGSRNAFSAVADYDGDGRADISFITSRSQEVEFIGTRAGNAKFKIAPSRLKGRPIVGCDFDGDGISEVGYYYSGKRTLTAKLSSTQVLQTIILSSVRGELIGKISCGDINGDKKDEVIVPMRIPVTGTRVKQAVIRVIGQAGELQKEWKVEGKRPVGVFSVWLARFGARVVGSYVSTTSKLSQISLYVPAALNRTAADSVEKVEVAKIKALSPAVFTYAAENRKIGGVIIQDYKGQVVRRSLDNGTVTEKVALDGLIAAGIKPSKMRLLQCIRLR